MFPADTRLTTTTATDIVSLTALHLAATVGPDHWHRIRPQPIYITLHLHLSPSYLDAPGRSDDVADSLHYGHLAKALERRVGGQAERDYGNPRALVEDVTDAAFAFVRDALAADAQQKGEPLEGSNETQVAINQIIHAVRVVLDLPKQILLAEGFQVEFTTTTSDWLLRSTGAGVIVRVTNLVLPVLIGVNPPERLAKQRVVTHLTFFEAASTLVEGVAGTEARNGEVDYPAIVQQIVTDVESSTHLTLEKLVYEIICTAYRASGALSGSNTSRIQAITVRCQKPSALSFADASCVEMTRTLEALRLVGK